MSEYMVAQKLQTHKGNKSAKRFDDIFQKLVRDTSNKTGATGQTRNLRRRLPCADVRFKIKTSLHVLLLSNDGIMIF